MTSKLVVFNEALGRLREEKLSSLSENVKARRVLDTYYDGACAACLEAGFWNFAMRAIEQTASVTLTPAFGYENAFEKPSDWVRTLILSETADMAPGLMFNDEAGVWYADPDTIYGKYVSNDTSYGMDLSKWPQSFADYVTIELAVRAGPQISNNMELVEGLAKMVVRVKRNAQGKDAMNEPPSSFPRGSWVNARRSGFRFPTSQKQP